VTESWYTRGPLILGVGFALILVVMAVGAGVDALIDSDTADSEVWIDAVGAFSGAAVVGGLLTSRRNPLLGIGLVAVGAITIAAIFYWLLVIGVPIAIGLVAIAFFRARSTGWPRGAGTA
jgi:hypothetical protein